MPPECSTSVRLFRRALHHGWRAVVVDDQYRSHGHRGTGHRRGPGARSTARLRSAGRSDPSVGGGVPPPGMATAETRAGLRTHRGAQRARAHPDLLPGPSREGDATPACSGRVDPHLKFLPEPGPIPHCVSFAGTGSIPAGRSLVLFDRASDPAGHYTPTSTFSYDGQATPSPTGAAWTTPDMDIGSGDAGDQDSHIVILAVLMPQHNRRLPRRPHQRVTQRPPATERDIARCHSGPVDRRAQRTERRLLIVVPVAGPGRVGPRPRTQDGQLRPGSEHRRAADVHRRVQRKGRFRSGSNQRAAGGSACARSRVCGRVAALTAGVEVRAAVLGAPRPPAWPAPPPRAPPPPPQAPPPTPST